MADEPRPDAETNPPQAAADEPEPSTKGEPDKIAALESELAETKDRLLRTLAEMENLRRRSEREMADTRQYAVANFARDMLTVSDNLRRAIDALPNKPDETSDPALAALIEGAGEIRRPSNRRFGREIRPGASPGYVRNRGSGATGRQRGASRTSRLSHRRTGAQARYGRRREGWPQAEASSSRRDSRRRRRFRNREHGSTGR
jgi:hypothetical protein